MHPKVDSAIAREASARTRKQADNTQRSFIWCGALSENFHEMESQ
jgi:hypothetical protein